MHLNGAILQKDKYYILQKDTQHPNPACHREHHSSFTEKKGKSNFCWSRLSLLSSLSQWQNVQHDAP